MSPGVVLIPDPYMQTRQRLDSQFTDCLEKCDFFVNESKYRHIIYYWKSFFTTSIDSRSLPQNRAPFGSNQLSKFCYFAWKYASLIRALSSWTKGTIMTRRPQGIDLHPKPSSKVAGEGGSTSWVHGLSTHSTPLSLAMLRLLRIVSPPYLARSESSSVGRVAFWVSFASNRNWPMSLMREREREQRGEISVEGERKEAGWNKGDSVGWSAGGLPALKGGGWWMGKWGRRGREGGWGLFLSP